MSVTRQRSDVRPALAIGDVVEVKPAQEILAGLDERGELDALPFMPEMLQFCGQRFVVDKIAFKTCDTATWTGLRRMMDTVHLSGVRCDGQAHGGCQAGCLVFWKAAWLTKISGPSQNGCGARPTTLPLTVLGPSRPEPPTQQQSDTNARPLAPETAERSGCTRERLTEVAMGASRPRHPPAAAPDQPVYSCQATELTRAAPIGIPFWDLRQYAQDVRTGNAPMRKVVRGIAIGVFNLIQDMTRRKLPERMRFRGGLRYPFIQGAAGRTPIERLDLQPGEWVRIKSIEQIRATLDANGNNRGLSFDGEMLKYCGRTAQVLRRVEHIIDESSGQMLTMKTPCIVMADVVCTSDYHRSCPRGIYSYWREIWLERVQEPDVTVPASIPSTARVSQQGGQRS